jgi:hypothetical protein
LPARAPPVRVRLSRQRSAPGSGRRRLPCFQSASWRRRYVRAARSHIACRIRREWRVRVIRPQSRPSRAASATAAVREPRPSLLWIFATWRCTVCGLTTSCSAISRSLSPASRASRGRRAKRPLDARSGKARHHDDDLHAADLLPVRTCWSEARIAPPEGRPSARMRSSRSRAGVVDRGSCGTGSVGRDGAIYAVAAATSDGRRFSSFVRSAVALSQRMPAGVSPTAP